MIERLIGDRINGQNSLTQSTHQECVYTEERLCGDTASMQPSPNHTERLTDRYLDLRLLTFRTVRNKFLLFKPPSLWHLVMVALANECIFLGTICHFAFGTSEAYNKGGCAQTQTQKPASRILGVVILKKSE